MAIEQRDLSEYKQNVRVGEMIEKCSDEKAIIMAESIAAHRLAGLDTWVLEKQLDAEVTRMNAATRIFCGKQPELKNYPS